MTKSLQTLKALKLGLFWSLLAYGLFQAPSQALAEQSEQKMVTIMHYFTGDLGRQGLHKIFADFQKQHGVTIFDNPLGHEDFKSVIIDMAATNQLPDMFSYWAGARTQFVVNSATLHPIDDLWRDNHLDDIIPASISNGGSIYNGRHYLIPFGYHATGFFYNPKVLKAAGISTFPKTWEDFLKLCQTLADKGITPIALGAKNRWPAQFWFDYLILRTMGAEKRNQLMNGTLAYDSAEVQSAMTLWRDIIEKGYIQKAANSRKWSDAADAVIKGEAAMTLMGTWITGYWDTKGFQSTTDYDFAEFPEITPGIPRAMVGPIDGILLANDAHHLKNAETLALFMIKDLDVQKTWSKSQGALSPNKLVSKDIYSDVMKAALNATNEAKSFAFNYDLATPPAVAEVGLQMFLDFLQNPDQLPPILQNTQKAVHEIFNP